MASFMNRPDKLTADSFSDTSLLVAPDGGIYSEFTNMFNTPLLKVKGLQLLRANFVNPLLQLNDYSQLTFWYYRTATASTAFTTSNLYCVRLLPSWYVPAASFTAFTRNSYFNNGTELVAALNLAAATGGDNVTYNTRWIANDVTFTFNSATRKISFTGNTATNYYSPAAVNDPNVKALIIGLTMNTLGGVKAQPYSFNISMNERLGFGQAYLTNGRFWGSSSQRGCASASGVPQVNAVATEGDTFPILIGSQNINVYCSVINGSGNDSRTNKNLLATIPLENVSQGVVSYTLSSVEQPAMSVSTEIYNIVMSFTDDFGDPVYFAPNTNINLELNVFY
jgi:hypothetical protein